MEIYNNYLNKLGYNRVLSSVSAISIVLTCKACMQLCHYTVAPNLERAFYYYQFDYEYLFK